MNIFILQNKPKKTQSVATMPRKRRASESESDDESGFDLKQARHDVQRFGIKGMDDVSKEQATLNMLVRLGAQVLYSKVLFAFLQQRWK